MTTLSNTLLASLRRVSIIATLATILVTGRETVAAESAVFAFGNNQYRQTGLNIPSSFRTIAAPIDATNLTGKTITQVAAARPFSLLLADDGTVFSFGSNNNGLTGLNTADGQTRVATPIDTTNLTGYSITQIAATGYHSLLLADDGTVFSFGSNSNGRTGLGFTSDNGTLIATPIDTTNLTGKTITQVAAGFGHNLLLADDGTVFSFGSNVGGQTGLNATSGNSLLATPIDATNLTGKKITQIAAGGLHSLLLADDGTVFSFGSNQSGVTGLGFASFDATPIATPIDSTNLSGKRITQIAVGDSHSLMLADDGTVFSFGYNFRGATGLNTTDLNTPVATPIDTTNLAGKTITQVAAGSFHSLLLADDGTVFSFGYNDYGRTGLGFSNYDITRIATPIHTGNLTGRVVTQITAGWGHSLLLTASLVPEPTTIPLLLLAMLPLLRKRSLRKYSQAGGISRI